MMWLASRVNVRAGVKLDFGWRRLGSYCTYSRWTLVAASSLPRCLCGKVCRVPPLLPSLVSKTAGMGSSTPSPEFFVQKEKWGQPTKIKAQNY